MYSNNSTVIPSYYLYICPTLCCLYPSSAQFDNICYLTRSCVTFLTLFLCHHLPWNPCTVQAAHSVHVRRGDQLGSVLEVVILMMFLISLWLVAVFWSHSVFSLEVEEEKEEEPCNKEQKQDRGEWQ